MQLESCFFAISIQSHPSLTVVLLKPLSSYQGQKGVQVLWPKQFCHSCTALVNQDILLLLRSFLVSKALEDTIQEYLPKFAIAQFCSGSEEDRMPAWSSTQYLKQVAVRLASHFDRMCEDLSTKRGTSPRHLAFLKLKNS